VELLNGYVPRSNGQTNTIATSKVSQKRKQEAAKKRKKELNAVSNK